MKLRNNVYLILFIFGFLFPWEDLGADDEGGVAIKKTRLTGAGNGGPGFTLLDRRNHQVNFENKLDQAAWLNNQNLLNGSGVALGDFDQDGHCDIYLCSLSGSNRPVSYTHLTLPTLLLV